MLSDLKYAFRALLKTPGFSIFAILTFTLGIGACTAMFSVVRAVLLKPLPFREPERLVWIENNGNGGLSNRTTRVNNFLEWQKNSRSFEALGAYFAFFDYRRYTLNGSGEPQRLRAVTVSQNLLDVLGVRPFLGRNFTPEEAIWNGPQVILLSHSFWQQHFASDLNIVGKTVTLDGNPTEIIGVLPASFDFAAVFAPGTEVQMLVPFPLVDQTDRWGNTIFGIGRLKPSATIEEAKAELAVISQRTFEAHRDRGPFGARLSSINHYIRGPFRPAFFILSGAVVCVQLIACVNLSSLLLTRANGRRKELAVRVALGASGWHLIRQSLAETSLLALAGCAFGVPLASAATRLFAGLKAFSIPMLQTTTVDGPALAFTVALSGVTVLLCGLLPALQAAKGRAQTNLAAGQRGSGGKHTSFVRKGLVITEIALACVLLVGASLLIRSFSDLLKVNLGFQPEHAMAWRADPTVQFKSQDEKMAYLDRLVERALAVPGVISAGVSDTLPLGRNRSWGAKAKGATYAPGEYPTAFPRMVDYRYLQAMNIPLKAGRYFTAADNATSPKALIINESMAKRLWPDRDALNQIALVGGNQEFSVVGIVSDVRHASLEEKAEPEMYINMRQFDDALAIELVVRTSRSPASLIPDMRATLTSFDPTLPNSDYRTLNQIVDQAVAPRRLITDLLASFSLLAVAFAAVGLYGVISYSVSQRTKEVGIRLAIGAQPRDVVKLIVSEGLTLALVGIGVGIAAALLATRVLRSLLFGVSATDPVIFFLNALVIAAIALLACYLPARRARRINPLVALREE